MEKLMPILEEIARGAPLSRAMAEDAFEILLNGEASAAQIGAFLVGLRVRGETIDELRAGATIMRRFATPVMAPANAIDTCGTGGDKSGTYNISTACAFVVAACGVPVAKHGNRALSSKSGSSQILEELGVNIAAEKVEASLAQAGIGFMFAPAHHAAMRHVGSVRQELGTGTIFNLLGPLSNPAGAKRQLLGVFDKKWLAPFAHVLHQLGSEYAWIVHGADGLDELTTTDISYVAQLKHGEISSFEIAPEDFGISRAAPEDLQGGTPAQNAAALKALLQGENNAYRDIVLLNSAAALLVAEKADSIDEGLALAAQAIDTGGAQNVLDAMVKATNA